MPPEDTAIDAPATPPATPPADSTVVSDPPATPPVDSTPPATPPAADSTPPAAPPATPPVVSDSTPPAQMSAKDWLSAVPEGWREELVGDDESRLTQLKRIPSFNQLVDNYFEARRTISAGEHKAPVVPTTESSDEDWTKYRETNGIPATAEEYDVKLDDGLLLGDEDKAVLSQVYPVAHELNLPAEAVSKLTNAMIRAQATQYHAEQVKQEEYRKEASTIARSTWGGDYDSNIMMIKSAIIDALPESIREDFEHAQLADGRKLFNSPEMLIAFSDWARKISPSATVVPNVGNPMQAIESEIAQLEARMGDPDWFEDEAANKRYRDLVTARDEMGV